MQTIKIFEYVNKELKKEKIITSIRNVYDDIVKIQRALFSADGFSLEGRTDYFAHSTLTVDGTRYDGFIVGYEDDKAMNYNVVSSYQIRDIDPKTMLFSTEEKRETFLREIEEAEKRKSFLQKRNEEFYNRCAEEYLAGTLDPAYLCLFNDEIHSFMAYTKYVQTVAVGDKYIYLSGPNTFFNSELGEWETFDRFFGE